MNRRAFLGSLGASTALTGSLAAASLLPRLRSGIGTWQTITPVPTARSYVAVTALRDRLYVVGGRSALGGTLNEVYDPTLDLWLERAPLPHEVVSPAAVGFDGKVYVIGGFLGDDPLSTAFEYNPLSDQWRPIAPLPTPRGALAAAVLDGKIYAVGGRGAQGPTGRLDRYDPKLNLWETLMPLPQPRESLMATVINRRLHVIGGETGVPLKVSNAHDVYDIAVDRWTSAAPLPTARAAAGIALLRGHVCVVGGRTNETASAFHEAYDAKAGAWSAWAALPHPRFATGAATIGTVLYLPAGESVVGRSAPSDINEAFSL